MAALVIPQMERMKALQRLISDRTPPFNALRAERIFPAVVLGPVERIQGVHRRMAWACLWRASGVQRGINFTGRSGSWSRRRTFQIVINSPPLYHTVGALSRSGLPCGAVPLGSFGCHVVDDEDLVQVRAEDCLECIVGGVGKVHFQAGFVLEGHVETVGESFVLVFWAYVGSPFVAGDGRHFGGQLAEGVFHGFHLFGGGGVLEFEEDDVAVHAGVGGGGRGGGHKSEDAAGEGGAQGEAAEKGHGGGEAGLDVEPRI